MFNKEKNKIFGIIDNVAAKYTTSRKGETHTKKVHLPPAFDGDIRIDDILEPSRFLLVSFKGLYDTFYIGIQSIAFYSEHGQQIHSFENIAVDGETVDNEKCMPVLPSNDGWIAAGDEHSLLFDFGKEARVSCVSIKCTHGACSPKEVYFTDGMVPAELLSDSPIPRYANRSYIQLAGEPTPVDGVKFRLPSEFKKKVVACEQLMEHLNANPPARGFQSFLSDDGKDVFAFYQQGCCTRACDYFFGKDPAHSVKFVNSLVKRKIETVVENAVNRAMTLKELQAVRTIIVSDCHKKKWKSSRDGKTGLAPDDVNMDDFYSNVIKPMTKKSKCSMTEILGSGCECSPVYYVCHSMGQSVLDLIQCCEQHAVMNNLSSVEATYWIASFALRENEFGAQSNLSSSAFTKAIAKAKGVLLISDPNVTVANRVWIHYELIQAVDLQKKIDIAIFDEGKLKIKTEYEFPHETKYQHRTREQEFPTKKFTEKFLAADLLKAESWQKTDKIRILNTLCSRKGSIDDGSVLNSSSKDIIENLDVVHSSLRAQIASRAIVSAITTDGQNIRDYFGSNLFETIKSSNDRKVVIYDLFELDCVSDEAFISLIDTLGPETEMFGLNVNNCSGLTDACLKDIVFPAQLKKLKLDIGKAHNISNKSLLTLAEKIPSNLEYLFLDVSGYKSPNGTYLPRFNDHLNALSLAMPGSGLDTFALNTNLDDSERSPSALLDLANSLPGRLKTFSLTLRWGQGKTGSWLPKFVANLPHTVEHLSLAIKGGPYVDDGQLVQLRNKCERLKSLKSFQLTTCDDGKRGFYAIRNFDSIAELEKACLPVNY